jgi:hypothetical protein
LLGHGQDATKAQADQEEYCFHKELIK